MRRKVILGMLLICVSLTACVSEKNANVENTNAAVEENVEENMEENVEEDTAKNKEENAEDATAENTNENEVESIEESAEGDSAENKEENVEESATDSESASDIEDTNTEDTNTEDTNASDDPALIRKVVGKEQQTDATTTETEQTQEEAKDFTVEPLDEIWYVTQYCNIYAGPSYESYNPIGELNYLDEVWVTGDVDDGNWLEITLEDGTKGYMVSGIISKKKPTKDRSVTVINPSTGKPYKPGDLQYFDDGSSARYMGSFDI